MSWLLYVTCVTMLLSFLVPPVHAAPLYTLADLGPAVLSDLNDGSVATGWIFPSETGRQQAVRLQEGQAPQLLGFLVPGGWGSFAYGIGPSGAIVGMSATDTTGCCARAFRWTPDAGMQPLPELPGADFSQATDLNGVGTIVGFALVNNLRRPVVWIADQPSDLGTLGGTEGFALAVNEMGDIVGESTASGSPAFRATLWPVVGGVVDLQTLPGRSSFANALTNDQRVVGQIDTRGFFWTPARGMMLLPLLAGDTTSSARGINEAGVIVGSSEQPSTFVGEHTPHAVRWLDGVPEDLNTLVDAPGWDLYAAVAINSSGQIAGFGDLDGAQHTFLLTPALSPAPVALRYQVYGDFNGDGEIDTAGVAVDDTLWRQLRGEGWHQLPGVAQDLVVGDVNGDGRDDLAAVGTDTALWLMTDGQHWESLHGSAGQLVAGDFEATGHSSLVARGEDTRLWIWRVGRGWQQLPGFLTSMAAGDFLGLGYDQLAGTAIDTVIWIAPRLGAWQPVNGFLQTLVGGNFTGQGHMELAGIGYDHSIWFSPRVGAWQPVVGNLTSIEVVAGGPGLPDGLAGHDIAGTLWYAPTIGAWRPLH